MKMRDKIAAYVVFPDKSQSFLTTKPAVNHDYFFTGNQQTIIHKPGFLLGRFQEFHAIGDAYSFQVKLIPLKDRLSFFCESLQPFLKVIT
ncbi:MAG: hypothetical protein A4E56_00194 [Pelotomaculum sp. PtaU1.Bin065]|nr:MAG: hypothetical protein A4E56_00194 [Pelotomaculum sp. PtaU1.Bin065]